MPFDEEDDNSNERYKKQGIKNVSGKPSIFDNVPKKPTRDDLHKAASEIEKKSAESKNKAAEIAIRFNKSMKDKTLEENKNVFQVESQKELIADMVKFALETNADPNEPLAMGCMGLIVMMIRNSFAQRDRINQLEYSYTKLQAKLADTHLSAMVKKEVSDRLDSVDKKKDSE